MKKSERRGPIPDLFRLSIIAVLVLSSIGCGDRLLMDDPRILDIQVEAPVFALPPGVYGEDVDVVISCATPGAEIHYTVDGSDPTERSPRFSRPTDLQVKGNGTTRTFRAIAVKSRLRPSAIVVATYTISIDEDANPLNAPTISPAAFSTRYPVKVAITQDEPGATIYYTSDGSDPRTSSTRIVYTGPFTTPWSSASATTIKATAKIAGRGAAPLAAETYTFLPPKLYAAIAGKGIYVSEDDGKNWSPSYTTIYNLYHIFATSPSHLYASSATALIATADGGATWQTISTITGMTYAQVFSVGVRRIDDADGTHLKDVVYAGCLNNGLYRNTFDVASGTWESVAWSNILPNSDPVLGSSAAGKVMSAIYVENDDVYLGLNQGIAIYRNGAWSKVYLEPSDAAASANYVQGICRFDVFLIASTKDGVYASPDNGATWTRSLDLSPATAFGIPAADSAHAYAKNYFATKVGASLSWEPWNLASSDFEDSTDGHSLSYGNAVLYNHRGLFLAGTLLSLKYEGRKWYSPVPVGLPGAVKAIAAP